MAALLTVTISFAPLAFAAETIATDVRVGLHDDRTRVVLELSRPVDAGMFLLENPYRVVLDLPETGWQLPAQPLPAPAGIFKTLRYGLYQPGQSRMVLETTHPPKILKVFYLTSAEGKYRLVLDMAESDPASFARSLNKTTMIAAVQPADSEKPLMDSLSSAASGGEPGVAAAVDEELIPAAPQKPDVPAAPRKRIIAIDAGHGGADPGAIGRSGIYEKHITLAFAKEMKQVLEASGRYTVHLTRDRDIFIPLRERVAKARRNDPDLFLSLHADSIKNKRTQGLSVYTLSENASDKEAALLAEKENKADIVAGMDFNNEPPEIANILIDLAQRDTLNESARFANLLIGDAKNITNVLRKTHRFAGFAVLKAPDVPSVLVELGFLSNSTDEKNLQSRAFRRKFAEAALRALDSYFANVQQAHTY
ncbi:MAG: N-acetylmuramoyl-L-alanine amidase [Rhodospirillales bacterium]